MAGDAQQIAGAHTATAAMAYLSNIISGFLNALESLTGWLARRWDKGHGLTGPRTPSGTYVTKGFRSRREDFAVWPSDSGVLRKGPSSYGSDENVAVFGTFTYKSNTLRKVATSPFSILAKVKNGKIVYFQFMEDTFATAATFRVSGHWRIHSDPKGAEFEL